jgi:L-asparagine transporter-like permease
MRLPGHPFFTVVNIALLLGISVTTFFVEGLEWSIPAFTVFLSAISLVYLIRRKQER